VTLPLRPNHQQPIDLDCRSAITGGPNIAAGDGVYAHAVPDPNGLTARSTSTRAVCSRRLTRCAIRSRGICAGRPQPTATGPPFLKPEDQGPALSPNTARRPPVIDTCWASASSRRGLQPQHHHPQEKRHAAAGNDEPLCRQPQVAVYCRPPCLRRRRRNSQAAGASRGAFAYYRTGGVARLVCEEKHRGRGRGGVCCRDSLCGVSVLAWLGEAWV